VVNTLWEIAFLTDEIGSLKKTNKELNEHVSKLEASKASGGGTTPGQPLFSSLFSDDKSTEAEVHREIKESKIIETNMIVSGIPEASNGSEEEKAAHDKTSVEALLTALETPLYEMKRFKRVKTNNEKPNLILIEFGEAVTLPSALRKAKNLRTNDKFKGVYVNKDMTRTERIIEKRLRDERNWKNKEEMKETGGGEWPRGLYESRLFHWGIRSGEVRRIFDKPT
jgi:hypothetical protein